MFFVFFSACSNVKWTTTTKIENFFVKNKGFAISTFIFVVIAARWLLFFKVDSFWWFWINNYSVCPVCVLFVLIDRWPMILLIFLCYFIEDTSTTTSCWWWWKNSNIELTMTTWWWWWKGICLAVVFNVNNPFKTDWICLMV